MPRISGKDAEGLMAAYAKVHAPKEEEVAVETPVAETPTEDIQEQGGRLKDRAQVQDLRNKVKPFMNQGPVTVSSNNASGTPQRISTGTDAQQSQQTTNTLKSTGAQQAQQMAKDKIAAGKNTVTGQSKGQPQSTPAQQAQQMAKDRIAAGKNTVTGEPKTPVQQQQRTVGGQGNRQMPVKTGGIQLGKAIKGGLGRLGSLAGRAVGAVKQGVQKVAGALSNKGPIQGRQTGTQRRAQQGQQGQSTSQAKPTGQATPTAAQTAAAKADTTSPAAKAGLSSDMRAQAAANNANFQANRASQTPMDRRNARLAAMKNKGRPLARLNNEYDPMEDVFDDTINFLVSEGYVSNEAEALTVMAEQEFIDSFTEGYQQVINEEAQK